MEILKAFIFLISLFLSVLFVLDIIERCRNANEDLSFGMMLLMIVSWTVLYYLS